MKKNLFIFVAITLGLLILVMLGVLLFGDNYFKENNTDNLNNLSNIKANNTYNIVDTGQDSCSSDSFKILCPSEKGDFYGQDAQYTGNEPKYKDNGNGTVTDLVTGLMWQQDPGDKVDYYDAIMDVDSFELAGYSDWRVPTIKELYSLIDFRGTDPSSMDAEELSLIPFIDEEAFMFYFGDIDNGDRVIDSQWVTSNIYKSDVMSGQECFFGVNFADGRIKCYPTQKNKGYFSIYVRGNTYGENNFVDNGNQTITDQATGLMWQKSDNGTGVDWENALSYCESLNLSGYSNWRLPNAKELQSIVDYSKSPDTTNSAAIDSIFDITQITNEDNQLDYPYFWSSTTHIRTPNIYTNAVYVAFGRALGYMKEFGGYVDVHGAGAQRSDPKSGNPEDLPVGRGPQGDVQRIENYVRCVRDDFTK